MVVGVVRALWRYPVKSMLGERCESLTLDPRGVVGDRVWAIRTREGKLGSGKTSRRFQRIEGLLAYRAVYEGEVPVITSPDGRRLRGDDPGVHSELSAAFGEPVTLAREDSVSHLDAGPVHLLTTASLAWLAASLPDAALDERRFRPNVLVEVAGARPVENEWLGKDLRIADVRLSVRKPTGRCVMVTMAQSELPDDARVMRVIAEDAGSDFGIYADVTARGRLRVGDAVTLVSAGHYES